MSGLKASVMGTKGPARSLALSSGRLIEAVYNPVRGSTPLLRKLMKLKALECSEVVVDMGEPPLLWWQLAGRGKPDTLRTPRLLRDSDNVEE
ncbi:hypothetical protein ALP93_200223 [Pseudomonas syringae pv. helianthi]|nr:hypothetical protein ALP93_200223 [Pseudomonas syringae pv. helianthi]